MDLLINMATFVRVVESGSLAAAAKELGLSATMVGKHLGALEGRLGARFLNRTTRRQSLTEAGTVYVERCKQLLAAVTDAFWKTREAKSRRPFEPRTGQHQGKNA